jgi:hypothetical protein
VKTATPAFLLAFCIATAAQAADIVRTPQASGPDFVTIAGEIREGDEDKFYSVTQVIRRHPDRIFEPDLAVILNSKGGWNAPAARIGIRIKQLHLETRLHSGSLCNGACILIFMGGGYRHMDKDTALGLHSAGFIDRPWERAEKANKEIATWLKWAGAPQQMIELQPKADLYDINYVTYDMAKEWGILKPRPKSE